MKTLKTMWIVLLTLFGGIAGAILLGLKFSSIPLAILGACIGVPIGYLLGKHIPFWEWFAS